MSEDENKLKDDHDHFIDPEERRRVAIAWQ
jgi:hypothetical protein